MTTYDIEFSGVYKSFGQTKVLEDVYLTVERQTILGVIGPNGGGKTVMLKLILGLLKPDQGTIRVLGETPENARGMVGYVPQTAGFDASFPINVRDVVLTGRQRGSRLFRPYSAQDRKEVEVALDKVDMGAFSKRQIGELSGGQIQRVLIARALVTKPKIILLDEPTANLDPMGGRAMYELLGKLKEETTVVLVSHDVGVISKFVSSVACVNRRLFQHAGGDAPQEIIEKIYDCPIHFMHDHDAHHPLPHAHAPKAPQC